MTKDNRYDMHSKLTRVKWGMLYLPVVSINNSIKPRLEENQFINKKANHVRSLGFDSRVFDVELVFDAHTETYPEDYKTFLSMVMENEPAILKHPILGEILCLCSIYGDSLTYLNRSGVKVNVSFIETLSDKPSELVDIESGTGAAFDLATQYAVAREFADDDSDIFEMLDDINELENQLKGINSSLTMKVAATKSKIKNKIVDTIEFIKAIPDASTAIMLEFLRIKSEGIEANEPKNKIYIVEKDMSLFELSATLNLSTDAILEKNISLKGKIIIRENTTVLYE